MNYLDDAEAIELDLPADAWAGFTTERDGVEYVAIPAFENLDASKPLGLKWLRK